MSVPNYIADGNFAVLGQNGPGIFTQPFQHEGDTKSYEYRVHWRMKASLYTPSANSRNFATGNEMLVPFVTPRGIAYLIEQGDAQDCGAGIIEVQRTYAMYYTRYVGTSIVWPAQFLSTGASYNWDNPPPAPEVGEIPLPLNARIKWEYGLVPFDQIYAPKVATIFNTVISYGGWPNFGPVGGWFPAENSEQGIYNGFHYRKTVLIQNILPHPPTN
jgi:hypothetical protein